MLVLTGNPGVGKHTAASEIMKQNTMYEIIDINNLAIELGLAEKAKETLEVYVAELKIKMKIFGLRNYHQNIFLFITRITSLSVI